MIELIKVNKYFNKGRTHAVRDVSFKIVEGETLVLLGSSGCGKTTILKMLNRLIDLDEGSIKINGETIFNRNPVDIRRSIGYVIQGIGLFPHMNIVNNVSIVLKLLGEPVSNRRARAEEVLELVGLDPLQYSSRYPDELSGGQQQRVGVARALAADPAILLMDEPFGALDAVTRDLLQQELLKIKARLKKTVVFVTHDIFEAFTLADRIAVMHEGQFHQLGTKEEIIKSPKTDFVRALLMKPKKQLTQFQEAL